MIPGNPSDRVLNGPTTDRAPQPPLRILTVSALWQGANDYAFVRALRRAGHSVSVVPDEVFIPSGWRTSGLRLLRRALLPILVREYTRALVSYARHLQPDLLFIFKGTYVSPEALRDIRAMGVVAFNYYPDTGFLTHGPYIPRALPLYDWVFTTKSFGPSDMESRLGMRKVSFLPHGYDPETHIPVALESRDYHRYGCDISFVGTYSAKKERLLEHVHRTLPELRLRIWGADWHRATGPLRDIAEHHAVRGLEYAKAILASSMSLAPLFEGNPGASSGDLTTARTFEIPAVGGFMLHERTAEAAQYFADGTECVFFDDVDDLIAKIRRYAGDSSSRAAIAAAGQLRSVTSGYSVDARVASVLNKYAEVVAARSSESPNPPSDSHA